MKDCKKRGKLFIGLGILVVVAVSIGLIVSFCGRHGFDMHKNPERIKKMVNWKVNDVLDDIDADGQQRRHILASVNELVDEGIKMHGNKDRNKQIVHAELAKAQPDSEKLHSMLNEKFEQWRFLAHKALDVILGAHATLTPEQREELLDKFEKHHHFN